MTLIIRYSVTEIIDQPAKLFCGYYWRVVLYYVLHVMGRESLRSSIIQRTTGYFSSILLLVLILNLVSNNSISAQMDLSSKIKNVLSLHKAGEYSQALREYESIILDLPKGDLMSQLSSNAGSIYMVLGDYENARVKFEQAVDSNDTNSQAHYNLAVTLTSKLNLHDKALTHCIAAIKLNSKMHKGT